MLTDLQPFIVPAMIAALGFLIRREFARLETAFATYDKQHADTDARLDWQETYTFRAGITPAPRPFLTTKPPAPA